MTFTASDVQGDLITLAALFNQQLKNQQYSVLLSLKTLRLKGF